MTQDARATSARGGAKVTGRMPPRGGDILTDQALAFVAELQRRFGARRNELLAAPQGAPGRGRPDGSTRTSCPRRRSPRRRRGRWPPAPPDLRRPPGRDHRADRAEDGDQRAQLRARRCGSPTWRTPTPRTGERRRAASSYLYDAVRRHARLHLARGQGVPAARPTRRLAVLVVRPRGWHLDERHVLVDGEPRGRRAGRLRPATSSTTPRSCSTAAAARTSTCPRPRATSRPGSGTTSSPSPRRASASPTARSGPRCSSRPSRRPSRWTRSSTSCATHASGLNAGRWDYLFSIIKYFRDAGAGVRRCRTAAP